MRLSPNHEPSLYEEQPRGKSSFYANVLTDDAEQCNDFEARPLMKTDASRSPVIDMLRGVAILAVMMDHLPFSSQGVGSQAVQHAGSYPSEPIARIMSLGHHGVLLFLVISGFCIHMGWARQRDLSQKLDFLGFWRRRLARLYPPFLFALGLTLMARVVLQILSHAPRPHLGAWFGYEQTSLFFKDLLACLTMTQNLSHASERIGNGPFWSLALEEQLYILYFILLWSRKRLGWKPVLIATAAITLAWRIIVLKTVNDASVPLSWAPSYWFFWALGAFAAEAYVSEKTHEHSQNPPNANITTKPSLQSQPIWVFLCFLVFPFFPEVWDEMPLGIGFYFAIRWLTSAERHQPGGLLNAPQAWVRTTVKRLAQLGGISYGVYLIHSVAFIGAKRIMMMLSLPPPIVLISRLSAGVIAGWILYKIIEVPALRWSKTFRALKPST